MKELKISKSIRISNSMISMINEYAATKGISFNKTIEEILEKFFFNNGGFGECKAQKIDKFIDQFFSKLNSMSSENQNMNFSMIDEIQAMKKEFDTIKKMVILSGRHISEESENELSNEFPEYFRG